MILYQLVMRSVHHRDQQHEKERGMGRAGPGKDPNAPPHGMEKEIGSDRAPIGATDPTRSELWLEADGSEPRSVVPFSFRSRTGRSTWGARST